ncbi:nucleotidyltransferase domain-containing protein [Spirillospora albida]|uniref:nucleotidyltransferase domain-containing protein n=1 Tax=Spirillospora albida TaxID=58123 RepID=UPI0004BFDCF8|nr:nucleotidyltransferase domain-containing protein [Spirillospora albida]
MVTVPEDILARLDADHPYHRAFVTVSGAHLYGFPSRDSDHDLRGVHLLPLEEIVGLETGEETVSLMWSDTSAEADIVTHDLAKFCRLLLRRNGYVLEQLTSPLVVATSPAHTELLGLVPGLLTSNHAHHYLGFARTQWGAFEKSGELKPLLYTFRVLLTGIHLMRAAEIQADLTRLYEHGPSYLPDLVEAKRAAEHGPLPPDAPERDRLRADVEALTARLEDERSRTSLRAEPSVRREVHEFVVRMRLSAR